MKRKLGGKWEASYWWAVSAWLEDIPSWNDTTSWVYSSIGYDGNYNKSEFEQVCIPQCVKVLEE